MAKVSKRFKEAEKVSDLTKDYPLNEAVEILGKMPKAKFDETVELSLHLGVDPKKSDQVVRGTVSLPHGTGKDVRVIVFTEDAEAAKAAGADEAGLTELIDKVVGGWLDFDVAISTVSAMKEVRKAARVLGPRGLMPNPKSGTVVDDVAAGIQAVKAGRVEYKMDKTANVAIVVGKRSFDTAKLVDNIKTAFDSLIAAKPQAFAGQFIKNSSVCSTMSPGVKVNFSEFVAQK